MADDPSSAYPAAPASRRRHDPASMTLGIGAGILATVIGLLVLAWAILFVTKGRFLKPTFERFVSRYSEREVKVAGDFQLYFDPFDIKFLAEGLSMSNPKWASRPNLFEARLIDTRIATLSLLFGAKRRLNWLALVDSQSDLEWDAAHKANTWTFSTDGAPLQIPDIRRAVVSGTGLRYRDPKMALTADIDFDTIKANDKRFGDAIRFHGGGSIRSERFGVSGALTSPNEALAGGRTQFALHADAVRTKLDVSGTLAAPTQFEGSDLAVQLRGQNLRNVFDLVAIPVPDTRAYRIRSHVTKQGDEWRFTRLTGNYGDSDIAGRMTVAVADRVKLTADLASRKVDILDIGPFIGYEPTALAAKGPAAAVKQTGGAVRILPDAPLRIDAIKPFDAHVVYKVATIRAPHVPVSNVGLTFDLDHSLLKLSPLTFDMAGGHVDSDISIDARAPAVVTSYDIRLSPTPMGKLLSGWGVVESGTTGTIKARVEMKGTGNTVRDSLATSDGRIAIILPRGTFWTRNIQLAEFDIGTFVQKLFQDKLKKPVEINCGLIGFTVKNGVAAADPILIDTDKNVMAATGGFSFRDESLDLRFRADAKKFSLFSGQAPVGINGHFASPGIQIVSPELISRAGAGIALGVVASPLAAVLAFVDVGDAKSAACGPVLAGATASAQRTVKGDPRKDVGSRGANATKASGKEPRKKVLGIF